MILVYPISYITNSVKSILSLLFDEVFVLSHHPSSNTHDNLKVTYFFPKELANEINCINFPLTNINLSDIKDIYLSETINSIFSTEEVDKIKKEIISYNDINDKNNIKLLLTLYRLFYEYDKSIDETNKEYKIFLNKFKSLQEILNSNEEYSDIEEVIKISFEELDLIKPNLRLKVWLFLCSFLNTSINLLIGISKSISEIIIDLYYTHTKEMPKLVLSLNCEGISYEKLNNKEEIAYLLKQILMNKSDTDSFYDELNKLSMKWHNLYKPRADSLVKINFYDFSKISIGTLLSKLINKPINITTSNTIVAFIE